MTVEGRCIYVGSEGDSWREISNPFDSFANGSPYHRFGPPLDGPLGIPVESPLLIGIAQSTPHRYSTVRAWLKNPRTLVPSGSEVSLRRDAGGVAAEAEIAVVIGRDTDGLNADNAHDYILGVTAVNDITSPDRNIPDPRNFESKSGIGYTPIGPWIDTDASIDDVRLTMTIDGKVQAESGAAELHSSIRECVAYVVSWTPLKPGDVIMTGAAHPLRRIYPGSRSEIELAGMRLVTQYS